jgi:hypothetical protein
MMKQKANSKIQALRVAVDSEPATLSANKSLPNLRKMPTNKLKENKAISDMSIDEINRIIDERILKASRFLPSPPLHSTPLFL